ncbi:MAG TPA: hypothetical protein VK735_39850 [Pseudonocardia sp.]|uniref:hypothetical protein n=1 Tax=Pseudonocardia sp. TaxID=60912 RepID=UPI002C6238E5|nr:hypothetical protein [Pseudonocardia sp.]HTF53638.1 hypothetical protein [Pseudonocardia sp.]
MIAIPLTRGRVAHRGRYRASDRRSDDRILTPGEGLLLCLVVMIALYFAVWAGWKAVFGG